MKSTVYIKGREANEGGWGGETGAVCMCEREKNGKLKKIFKNNYIYSVNPDWKAYRIAWKFQRPK